MRRQGWRILAFCAATGFLLLESARFGDGIRAGIRLCGAVLIPSLFPMSVLCALWTGSGTAEAGGSRLDRCMRALLKLPGQAAAPILLGLVGGYPLGVHALTRLYQNGKLNRREAVAVSAFCNNPGPAFLIGAVGILLFHSAAIGAAIWGICAVSAILTGILLANRGSGSHGRISERRIPAEPASGAFPKAVREGVDAMLRVCGIVILFCGMQAVIRRPLAALRLPDWMQTLLFGALELTTGTVSAAPLDAPLRFLMCTLFAGWGGLCVHAQAAEALGQAGLPLQPYLRGKLLHAGLSLLLGLVLCPWLFPAGPYSLPRGRVLLPILGFFLALPLFFSKNRWKKQKDVL